VLPGDARAGTGSDRAGACSFLVAGRGCAGQAGAGRAHSRCQFPNAVSVVNGHSKMVTATIPVGSGSSSLPFGVAVNPATNIIYVTNNRDGTVSVLGS
jgi:DNA-binding beta-propeller fold protein YncE